MEVISGIFGPQMPAALLNVEVITNLATKMGIDLNNIKTADEIKQLQEQAQTAMLQQLGGAGGNVQQGPVS